VKQRAVLRAQRNKKDRKRVYLNKLRIFAADYFFYLFYVPHPISYQFFEAHWRGGKAPKNGL
jgi:hypothetical protein